MAKYINLENLDVSDYVTVWDCNCSEFGSQTVMAVDDLNYLPTVEAEPVRHGYWIPVDGGDTCDEWECSACGKWMVFQYDMDYDDMCEEFPRCPKCGAKMDGGGE